MDVKDFAELWQKERKVQKVSSREIWDSRAEEFNSHKNNERLHKVVALLKEKNMLHTSAEVLDIGCGPGKYVNEFAKSAKFATGVDISPRMIQFAKENASLEGVKNAEFYELDWENADLNSFGWERKFDLVTAFMSPAINSKENLDKMIQASKGYCFLSNFVQRQDSIKDELVKHFGENANGLDFTDTTIYCSFNILMLYKMYPEITYIDTEWKTTRTLEQAYKYYTLRLESRGLITENSQEELLNYLKKIEKNGVVEETIKAKIAWMYWRVK